MEKEKIANIPYGPYAAVIVGATADGRPNYTTAGAYGVVSQRPVLYVSLKNTHCSTPAIRDTGAFSVNIPRSGAVDKTDLCGILTGNSADKSGVFTAFYDKAAPAPMIDECSVNYLCRVIRIVPVFDFSMFFGEIVAAYADSSCLEGGMPEALKADPTILMGKNYYSLGQKVGEVFKSGRAAADKLGGKKS